MHWYLYFHSAKACYAILRKQLEKNSANYEAAFYIGIRYCIIYFTLVNNRETSRGMHQSDPFYCLSSKSSDISIKKIKRETKKEKERERARNRENSYLFHE